MAESVTKSDPWSSFCQLFESQEDIIGVSEKRVLAYAGTKGVLALWLASGKLVKVYSGVYAPAKLADDGDGLLARMVGVKSRSDGTVVYDWDGYHRDMAPYIPAWSGQAKSEKP